MSSTFSPSLRIELIGDGDQSGIWGQTTNSNLGTIVEQAITGVQSIVMLDANYTMSNFNGVADEARNAVLVLSGTLTQQRSLIAPLVEKTYSVKNTTTGGFGVQIVGSSGTGVVIPNGQTIPVYCDGTNFYALVTGTATNFAITGNATVSGNLAVTGTSTFTGIPSGPTAAYGTNTTQLATTAFVQASVPAGVILLWSGSIASIPSGWLLCNGSSGTPDLRDRFVVGAGTTYAVGASGGATTVTLATTNLPSHTHSLSATGTTGTESVGHTHSGTTNYTDVNHNHYFSGTTGGMNASNPHTHGYPGHLNGGGGNPGGDLNGLDNYGYRTYAEDINHGHDYSGNTGYSNQGGVNHAHSFTTGNISANHTHSVTVTGTSGATGSGTAFSILPPYYALAYIMKA